MKQKHVFFSVRLRVLCVSVLSLFFVLTLETQATIRYVRPTSQGLGNGTSWANASNDLQLMINQSAAGDSVFVAAGTYKPNRRADALHTITPNDIDNAFVLKADVKIFGGFPNYGTATWANRNWENNPTILSGDIGVVGNITDNCRHVVISSGEVGTACLNGFIITQGYAVPVQSAFDSIIVNHNRIQRVDGGGIYNMFSSPTLTNLTIDNNHTYSNAAGIYNGHSSPMLTNVTISRSNLGGMQNVYSSPILTDVTITNNGGIGITCAYLSPILTNVTITNNGESGISCTSSSPILTNVTISGNKRRGLVCSFSSSPVLTNVAITNNERCGIYCSASSPILTNVTIANNREGGIFCTSSSPMLFNVRISDNEKFGISNTTYSSSTLTNVTISNNDVGSNEVLIYNIGGIYNEHYSNVAIRNSIMWGNRDINNAASNVVNFGTITYENSLIGGEPIGNGIILNSNPFFIDTANGNYRLSCFSPAVDAGVNAYLSGINTDLDGNLRVFNEIVDLGAYEYQGNAVLPFLSITSKIDTTICYGNKVVIPLFFSDVLPWEFTYATDNGVSRDIVQSIKDSLFQWELNPSHTTTYKIIALKAIGCVFPIMDSIQVQVINPIFTNHFYNDTLCSGEQTRAVVFAGTGNFYEWIASGDVIDSIPKGVQTGNFRRYTVENKGNTPLTSVITVTPKYIENGKTCVGKDTSFSVTVYPIPALSTVLQNDTLCDGEQTKAVVFQGAEVYEWTVAGNVSGLPTGSQTGNFGTYTLTNKTAQPTKSVITVIPQYLLSKKECEKTSQTFEIVVNPATIIHSFSPEKDLFLCGDESVQMEVNATGQNLIYQWYHKDSALQGEENPQYTLSAVNQANSGEYYVKVMGVCGDTQSRSIAINNENIKVLVSEWDDYITVDNTSKQFVGFQWYKNGKAVGGATKQTYQEKNGLDGCYSVELTLSDKRKIHSCERCFDKTRKHITLYPNPVKQGDKIKITFNPQSGHINFISVGAFNALGQQVFTQQVDGEEFELETFNLSPGVYVLKITTEDFWIYTEKMIVF